MKRVQDWLLRFRWQKLLLVWGVFLLIAAVLFAERSGVQYTHTRFRLSYLPQEQAISKAQRCRSSPPPACCSVIQGRAVWTMQESFLHSFCRT